MKATIVNNLSRSRLAKVGKFLTLLSAAGALLLGALPGKAAIVTVDPSTLTLGFMNVFNLPTSGTYPANPPGAYQFGSSWGYADLVSSFDTFGPNNTNRVTLSPNVIGDPSTYWYIGGGAAGNPGNKIMDANLYNETTGTYVDQDLTFTGIVLSTNLLSPLSVNQHGDGWRCSAFIKDFVGDYSSFTTTSILLTNKGPFSITLHTSSNAGHHIQWGFETIGPCVWASDTTILSAVGNVQVDAVVFSAPAISVPPAPTKVLIGNAATFTVSTLGTVTGYQWKTNGVNLTDAGGKYSGSQTATLTINNCQPADAGNYSVTVSGAGPSVSATNSLTVIDPSKITINPADTWHGYMNVSDLPTSGTYPANPPGNYEFGSLWGIADLVASFSGSVLTLSPNNINDPSSVWYTPSGAPGNPGNRIMEANMYVETTGLFQGTTLTFSGTILNTNLLNPTHVNQQGNGWTCVAFIRELSADYATAFDLAVTNLGAVSGGSFSIPATIDNDPTLHVQWGFRTTGPDVWATDPILPGLGNVVMAPYPHIVVTASSDGTTLSLSFPSVTGYTYTIQYKNNLADATWTTLTTRSGTGSTITVTDPTAGRAYRFYQVIAN